MVLLFHLSHSLNGKLGGLSMKIDRTSSDFSVGSLNVRGINDKIKRLAIYNWIKQKQFDIFMMQECYCAKETCSTWEKEWGGTFFFWLKNIAEEQ